MLKKDRAIVRKAATQSNRQAVINSRKQYFLLSFLLLVVTLQACRKFLDTEPPVTSQTTANVFVSDATAASVLTGIYADISKSNASLIGPNGLTSLAVYTGLSADELALFLTGDIQFSPFYTNELNSLISSGLFWNELYRLIFVCNTAIEALGAANEALTPRVRQQLLGEALFMRALCYSYLVNLYGDVPLVTGTDYTINATLPKTPVSEIYARLITDLQEARELMQPGYFMSDAITPYKAGSEERVRPSSFAVAALLARIYLYAGQYENAANAAAEVIGNTEYFDLAPLEEVFKKNSRATIWSLQPTGSGTRANTGEGALFILPPEGPNIFPNPFYLNPALVTSFEPEDLRLQQWVDSVRPNGQTYFYASKYKIGDVEAPTEEYIMVMRLAEQYLIRAEAYAKQNLITEAQQDVNAIRKRAGLTEINAGGQQAILDAILRERRHELFLEWGHRWTDLKRTGSIDSVMNIVAAEKGGSWSAYKALYPIPQAEINTNPNLEQNPGY